MFTQKGAPFVLVVVAVVVFGVLGPKWPKDQAINVVMGDAASRVDEIRVRYAESGAEDWTREATFRYGKASPAPRVIHHEARLADGPYDVEIEIMTGDKHVVVNRRIELHGGTTSIDVTEQVP